jgi:hypothetical protein
MKGGKRQLSQWNLFVQKVYKEGKAKDSEYEFKQALSDASKRKSEMGSMKSSSGRGTKKSRKSAKKSRGSRSMALAGGKSRKHRKH